MIQRHQPTVALIDICMPRLDGIAATRKVAALVPETRIITLTTFDLDHYLFEAIRAGAAGFLLKDATADELLNAVRTVASGHGLLSPDLTRRVIQAFATTTPEDPQLRTKVETLSPRERGVLTKLAEGLSNAEIARHLFLGESTVKTHVSNLLTKLDLRDRIQAVIFAYESGLTRIGRLHSPPE
ncbi:MAG: response regulator transcription factor [Actinomycetota bacterium]|nr:response regulator transcription factor [Actinomycetota bacterium]